MAPLPVIADIARVELHWSNGAGDTAENVFHVEAPGLTEAQIGATLEAAWDDTQQTFVSSSMEFHEWYITLLDGTSPQQIVPNGGHPGGDGGQVIPEASMVLSLRSATRGPRGRGRLFLGPISEAHVSNGHLDQTPLTACVASWVTFANAIEVAGDACRLVVASYAHSTAAPVTNISSNTPVGLQRRRLLRTR